MQEKFCVEFLFDVASLAQERRIILLVYMSQCVMSPYLSEINAQTMNIIVVLITSVKVTKLVPTPNTV